MVHGKVVGLMNGELVMGGILEGDCKDRMADRLLRSYLYGTARTFLKSGTDEDDIGLLAG